MTLTGTSARFELLASADLTSANVSGSAQIGTASTTVVYDSSPTIAYSMHMFITDGEILTLNLATGAVTGTVTGTSQVETATVIAAAGATSVGVVNIIFTAADVVGSPVTVPITVDTGMTTATLVAAAIRVSLAQNAVITAEYTIGGSGANITATRINKRSNDSSLNIAIPAGLGITAAATSTNTTAGVGEAKAYRVTGSNWDAKDFEGLDLPSPITLYSTLVQSAGGAGIVNCAGGTAEFWVPPRAAVPIFCPAGDHPWLGATAVTFEAIDGDALIYIDIHAGT